ncbi:MAG TPA: glucose-6-phosphate isomerase [Candidatus Avacidaminococcus intestinavium]|uniref:Glucose-6-phosphate isomerase n=1 Tax=Candidatus Avacidaminococcus intestinavium TaxID=2840684 RepID=A0A9D1SKK7_9FIRM|nr:glucose-6-phosphate isomerase [Candidatus Avacidaminococcus intestinavium]
MHLTGKVQLDSGFCFDYANMLGKDLIKEQDLEQITERISTATRGIAKIRDLGYAKGHLSKDGEPEPVFFTKLPEIKAGNPNTPESIARLKDYARQVWETKEVIIFFGIGGSYLGGKVLFDIQAGAFWNQKKPLERKGFPKVFFSGNNLDADQDYALLEELVRQAQYKKLANQGKTKVLLIPITKSGTTIETLTSFIYFFEQMKLANTLFEFDVTVVSEQCKNSHDNVLVRLAKEHKWEIFDIQKGIGGRFCIFSNPGLLTAALVGMDIEELLRGAREMELACQDDDVLKNPALLNATLKYIASEKYGCDIEVLMPYSMRLKSLGEWYVQLLAESLGKKKNKLGKIVNYGRTPIAAVGTTDMHAQTQQHQDGRRNKVIQFIDIAEKDTKIYLKNPFPEVKEFDKFSGMGVDEALKLALAANAQALSEDKRFNAQYCLPKLSPYYVGQLLYFLMLSVVYEGELADINAFDQPGVEAYKRIMKEKMQCD